MRAARRRSPVATATCRGAARGWRLAALVVAAACRSAAAVALADAPISGAPFLRNVALGLLPSEEQESEDIGVRVARQRANEVDTAPAEACADGDQADRRRCLQVPGRKCMWTRVETRDASLAVQASFSYCMPCDLDGEDIPCWTVGAWVNGKQVTDCTMSCAHQKRIQNPGYACSDGAGGVSKSQCFERGTKTGSKCMFLIYKDISGQSKGQCGPCTLPGTGTWGCPKLGAKGPEEGSSVTTCASQCEVPCEGPGCPAKAASPAAPPPMSPGADRVAAAADEMISAPGGYDEPTANPGMQAQAALLRAKAAGIPYSTKPPPRSYFPVVVYETPADYEATTLPPMSPWVPLWPGAWPLPGDGAPKLPAASPPIPISLVHLPPPPPPPGAAVREPLLRRRRRRLLGEGPP